MELSTYLFNALADWNENSEESETDNDDYWFTQSEMSELADYFADFAGKMK